MIKEVKRWRQTRSLWCLTTEVETEQRERKRSKLLQEVPASASVLCSKVFWPWPKRSSERRYPDWVCHRGWRGDERLREATGAVRAAQTSFILNTWSLQSSSPGRRLWGKSPCGWEESELLHLCFPWQHKTLHSDHETGSYVALDDSYMMNEKGSASFWQRDKNYLGIHGALWYWTRVLNK